VLPTLPQKNLTLQTLSMTYCTADCRCLLFRYLCDKESFKIEDLRNLIKVSHLLMAPYISRQTALLYLPNYFLTLILLVSFESAYCRPKHREKGHFCLGMAVRSHCLPLLKKATTVPVLRLCDTYTATYTVLYT
jgi:hypothetical protein